MNRHVLPLDMFLFILLACFQIFLAALDIELYSLTVVFLLHSRTVIWQMNIRGFLKSLGVITDQAMN